MTARDGTPFARTPNAERYLLESDTLRRRQLHAALLHGSSRVWRERRRIWPAVVGGLILVAVIVAAIAVTGAFQRQRQITDDEKRQRRSAPAVLTAHGINRTTGNGRGPTWAPPPR